MNLLEKILPTTMCEIIGKIGVWKTDQEIHLEFRARGKFVPIPYIQAVREDPDCRTEILEIRRAVIGEIKDIELAHKASRLRKLQQIFDSTADETTRLRCLDRARKEMEGMDLEKVKKEDRISREEAVELLRSWLLPAGLPGPAAIDAEFEVRDAP